MNYVEFFAQFGGSYRAKHCKKRGYHLPPPSSLPHEFIRLDPWEGEYLWNVAKESKVGVLEIGRRNGGSTFLLACATGAPITSIDIDPVDDGFLRHALGSRGDNVALIRADSTIARTTPDSIDLLFIDGDHTYDGCYADLKTWAHRVVPGGHVILHDSYAGAYGVQRAAHEFFGPLILQFDEVISPLIPANHWTVPTGSLAHFRRCS